MIDTDTIKQIPQHHLDDILAGIPMKRFGQAGEVADLVCYLASNSGAYITGQVIGINGGMYI